LDFVLLILVHVGKMVLVLVALVGSEYGNTVVGTCFFVTFGEKIVAVSESSFLIYGVDAAMRRNSL
jgi:hypothetical protein